MGGRGEARLPVEKVVRYRCWLQVPPALPIFIPGLRPACCEHKRKSDVLILRSPDRQKRKLRVFVVCVYCVIVLSAYSDTGVVLLLCYWVIACRAGRSPYGLSTNAITQKHNNWNIIAPNNAKAQQRNEQGVLYLPTHIRIEHFTFWPQGRAVRPYQGYACE